MLLSPRQKAIRTGNEFYNSNTPCKKCSCLKRYALSGSCVKCCAVNKKLRNIARIERHNSTRFNTNESCSQGHFSDRYVSSGDCVECSRLLSKKYQSLNRNHVNQLSRDRLLRVPEKVREPKRQWKKRNKGAVNAGTAKRWAIKKRALPPWVDIFALRNIYIECPSDHQVDHILPLQNTQICGLHVPWNLQYLTNSENASKGNTFKPYYEYLDGSVKYVEETIE